MEQYIYMYSFSRRFHPKRLLRETRRECEVGIVLDVWAFSNNTVIIATIIIMTEIYIVPFNTPKTHL